MIGTASRPFPGSAEDFEALVNANKLQVYSVAHSYLHRSADVDDIVQRTFIHAYFGYGQLRDQARTTGWLCSVARNMALQLNRTRSREVGLNGVGVALSAAASSVEEAALRADDRSDLLQAIGALSAKLREPLLLHYLGERTVVEIADLLSIPLGTVKRRLHDARRKLRVELTAVMSEEKQTIESLDTAGRLSRYLDEVRAELRQGSILRASDLCDEAFGIVGDDAATGDPAVLLYRLYHFKERTLRQSAGEEAALEYQYKQVQLLERMDGQAAVASLIGTLHRLAWSLESLGRGEEALELCERAYRAARDAKLVSACAESLYTTAVVKHNLGRDDYGLSELAEACLYVSECRDDENPELAALVLGARRAIGAALPSYQGERHAYVCATSSHLCLGDGRVARGQAPGFSGGNEKLAGLKDYVLVNDVFHLAGRCRTLLDDAWEVGATYELACDSATRCPMTGEVQVVSRNEGITVPAGRFNDCLHTQLVTVASDEGLEEHGAKVNRGESGTVDVWYAPGVGLARLVVHSGWGAVRTYELESYSVTPGYSATPGGSVDTGLCRRYLPLAVGNCWSYATGGTEIDEFLPLITYENRCEVVKVGDTGASPGEPFASVAHSGSVRGR